MNEVAAPGPLVAIVEDDAAIAEGLALNLKLQGYRTEVAGDRRGEAATRFDRGDDLGGISVRCVVMDDDAPAMTRKILRDGTADAARSTRNKGSRGGGGSNQWVTLFNDEGRARAGLAPRSDSRYVVDKLSISTR